MSFKDWYHSIGMDDARIVKQDMVSMEVLKECWDHQQKKIDEAYNIIKLQHEICEGQYEDPCRYDHNRNCQNHSWFGLEGEDCPVAQAKAAYVKWLDENKE